jgi:hypothetical protein
MTEKPHQQSVFPTSDSLDQIVEEAKQQLPIEHENDLMSLLQRYKNTLLKVLEKKHER